MCMYIRTCTNRMAFISIDSSELHTRKLCVCACVRARAAVGRSVSVRRRRAFPFRITKVQRAIPQCAYFYIHSRGTREVRIIRPAGRKKTLAERILRNDSTVSSSNASSSFLCSCLFPRKLICRCRPLRKS